jgi:hypothetical protein
MRRSIISAVPHPHAETIYLLEELRMPDGSGPLYNEREIDHMIDVKDLTDAIRQIWYVSALFVGGGLAFLLSGAERRRTGYRAIFHGGIATVIILLVIAGLILYSAGASSLCSFTSCCSRREPGPFPTATV